MRKRIIGVVAAVPLVLGSMAGPAGAEVNEVTPSTNEINKTIGWAHFTSVSTEDEVALTFVSTRGFDSCFEYRADDEDAILGAVNENTEVAGLWTSVCVNNSTQTVEVEVEEHVDVRLVFGAEGDERFDWTRVETLEPEEETEPVEPTRPETVGECKQGGWEALNYTNQGRCVSDVRKHNNQERQKAKKDAQVAKKAAKATAKGAKATKVKGKKK